MFIDEHGGRCAVAHLLVEDGRAALAVRIAATMKNSYLPDMIDEELATWVRGTGLTLEELAWVQPSYPYYPLSAECGKACPEICAERAPERFEWDGHSLRAVAWRPDADANERPTRTWESANGKIWGMFASGLKRLNGQTWEAVTSLPDNAANGAWAISDEELLAFGREVVWKKEGWLGWSSSTIPDSVAPRVVTSADTTAPGAWGAAWGDGREVWFVGGPYAIRVRGDKATRVDFPPVTDTTWSPKTFPVVAVMGTGPNDVWFGGGGPSLTHWNGTGLEKPVVPDDWAHLQHSAASRAVWTPAPGEVWFGGIDTLMQWKDGTFTPYEAWQARRRRASWHSARQNRRSSPVAGDPRRKWSPTAVRS